MTRLTLPNERTHQFLFRPQKAARPMVYNPFSRLDPPIGSELVKSVRTFGRTVDPTAGCSFYLSSMNIELLQSLRIDRDQPGSHARFRSKLAPRDGFEPATIALKVDSRGATGRHKPVHPPSKPPDITCLS